jgi:hypothetical protein
MSPFTIAVPATTANLGPGFDCLGAALNLYNHFTFSILPDSEPDFLITVTGTEADHAVPLRDRVSRDETNLLYQSFLKFYQHLGQIIVKANSILYVNEGLLHINNREIINCSTENYVLNRLANCCRAEQTTQLRIGIIPRCGKNNGKMKRKNEKKNAF